MPVVYRLCNIFVLPSVGPGETWGLAINEAMACDKPVIVSSRCGCAPDLVEENITGWSFEPGERGELKVKDQLKKILNDRSVLENMVGNPIQKIRLYSYPVTIEKIKQLLEHISASEKKKVR
jgi:glycosyltransferase involved in cell wall biosynthesis